MSCTLSPRKGLICQKYSSPVEFDWGSDITGGMLMSPDDAGARSNQVGTVDPMTTRRGSALLPVALVDLDLVDSPDSAHVTTTLELAVDEDIENG